jgi:hypothetical protein
MFLTNRQQLLLLVMNIGVMTLAGFIAKASSKSFLGEIALVLLSSACLFGILIPTLLFIRRAKKRP